MPRQIATADILCIISQSPTDVRPVFDSIVFTAVRLLRCDLAFVLLCDGATYSPAAVASPEGPHADVGPTNLPINPSANFPSRAILDKKMLHLPDWSRIDLPEHELKIHKMYGVNSALYLPLLREGECIGLLTLVGKRPNIFGASIILTDRLSRPNVVAGALWRATSVPPSAHLAGLLRRMVKPQFGSQRICQKHRGPKQWKLRPWKNDINPYSLPGPSVRDKLPTRLRVALL
jgi:hypothetical protein